MKECAYCKKATNDLTGEHVIPNGLLNLYPDQDITFSQDKKYKDNEGLTINDVCASCNNDLLGDLDGYGVSLIKENFMHDFKSDEKYVLSYNYNKLSRWLMKIAYNTDRVSKIDNAVIKNTTRYILHADDNEKPLFSIFGGLYVDMTAFGVQNEGLYYLPLQVIRQPYLQPKGLLIEYLNDTSTKEFNSFELKNAYTWYVFRFASAIFILILWNYNAMTDEIQDDKNKFIDYFPYHEFLENSSQITLERVTDNFMCKNIAVIDGKEGIAATDKYIEKVLGNRSIYEVRNEMDKFFTPERIKKGRLLNELIMFPDNKKLNKEYKRLFFD